jgi:hypothetical protein
VVSDIRISSVGSCILENIHIDRICFHSVLYSSLVIHLIGGLEVPFQCPSCLSSRSLGITSKIELPPDARWDEISLQVLRCSRCGFWSLAVYEESRRGALDSEIVHHMGYQVHDEDRVSIMHIIKKCPHPSNPRCNCSAHHKLGKKDEMGNWCGLSEMRLGFSFEMKLG